MIGYLKKTETLPSLILTTRDEAGDVRLAAVNALSFARNDVAAHAAAAALSDREWQVRAAAADAIGRIGQVSAATALVASLADSCWQVRQKAIQNLAGSVSGTPLAPSSPSMSATKILWGRSTAAAMMPPDAAISVRRLAVLDLEDHRPPTAAGTGS
ncbi:HEAT repeat domain-containing protein [Bradyrhizobium sp. B120]|uniref:HEAT repeat domain-containing protein n=1 Tax=Bradyrhizobium sp. B120 TaxID=3410088 RepID=UPI003B98214C